MGYLSLGRFGDRRLEKGGLFSGSACCDGGSAGSDTCVGRDASWGDAVDARASQWGCYA